MTLSSTSACCNMIDFLCDLLSASLSPSMSTTMSTTVLDNKSLVHSIAIEFSLALLQMFANQLHEQSLALTVYKEMLRLTQMPKIYILTHTPRGEKSKVFNESYSKSITTPSFSVASSLIEHVLNMSLILKDDDCVIVLIFHSLFCLEDAVSLLIQLLQGHSGSHPLPMDNTVGCFERINAVCRQLCTVSYCLVNIGKHPAFEAIAKCRCNEWRERLIGSFVRVVSSICVQERYLILDQDVPTMVQLHRVLIALLDAIIGLSDHDEHGLIQSDLTSHKHAVDSIRLENEKDIRQRERKEQILTLRLWLSALLFRIRASDHWPIGATPFSPRPTEAINANSVDDVNSHNSKSSLDALISKWQVVSLTSAPLLFGRLLAVVVDSKKQHDLINEICANDETVSYLINSCFTDNDISLMIDSTITDSLSWSPSVVSQPFRIMHRKKSLFIIDSGLSKAQFLFQATLFLLEEQRLTSQLDIRWVFSYLRDMFANSAADRSSRKSHKKNQLLRIVESLTIHWTNRICDERVIMSMSPTKQQQQESQFVEFIQGQLQFLLER
jgi:hypothetical protein